ncbi:hypothetical protein O1611_g1993 [Lasiodiplodia mahajangana]|uniref:Uncharacterized protein n=1 Tax=Lasiodiplodia mahajangana TaxID=1108764 RepID=A0ACC2JVU7_9PEZI|nr:hypothetical protein O1611_g1993 [Lasiodiplodia mahajangana]
MASPKCQVPSVAGAAPTSVSSQGKIEEAFQRFEAILFPSDKRLFQSTELEDVWSAVRHIEHEQSNRKSLRNTRRVEPLFQALKIFGNAIGPLCQGVPFLCYIWAPIKLMLVIFDSHLTAYELIIDAYSQIAQHLPRFDRLSNAFRDQPEFQGILTDVYADIIQFHTQVYKIARRGGWKRLFDASWKDFKSKFDVILTNLARNRDLVDREAISFDIIEAKANRRELIETLERRSKETRDWQLREVFVWLDLAGRDREQEDLLSKFQSDRHEGTCRWVFDHPKFQTWFDEEDPRLVLWLKGKPGSGKTTIASFIAEESPLPPGSLLICCLCSELLRRGHNVVSTLLRLICAQILRQKPDLLPFAYENYVKFNKSASINRIRELLGHALESLGTTFIILDGIDEYDSSDQTAIIDEIARLLKSISKIHHVQGTPSPRLKVMLCSRETKELLGHVRKKLSNILTIYLSREAEHVSRDIARYTKASLRELLYRFREEELDKVGSDVSEKADGMFLWVKLVIAMVDDQWSSATLRSTVDRLPKGLDGVYETILRRLQNYPDELQRKNAQRILGYLACALRPLKSEELCDGLVFSDENSVLNKDTKLGKGVLDICKPLIEERHGGQIAMVHFTARSGPYLSQLQIQSDLTRVCVRYLQTSTIFLPEFESGCAAIQIIQGLHNLFPYAYEFWIEHASSWKETPGDQSGEDLQRLLPGLLRHFERNNAAEVPNADSKEIPGPNPVVAGASPFSEFPYLVRSYIAFKYNSHGQDSKSCKTLDPDEDPTKLTEAYLRYREILESLLDGTFPSHSLAGRITNSEISDFRLRSQGSSYLCHWTGCIRSWIGFDNADERNQHEASHKQSYRCREQGCGIIFASQKQLRSHKRSWHMKETDWVIKRKNRHPELTEDTHQTSDYQEEEQLTPNYLMHWYRGSNVDFIRQKATNMALRTAKSELYGILERMTQGLKEQLSREEVEPLAYHFRKAVVKDFKANQVDELRGDATPNQTVPTRRLVKNLPFQTRLEAEAAVDIDASISVAIDMIIASEEPERTFTEDPNTDLGHLWDN